MTNLNSEICKRLKYCGKEIKIYAWAKLINPEVIEIGDWSQIDDFTFIVGGQGVVVGKRVHIASFSSIIGGGQCILGDYSGLSVGSRLITGNEFKGGAMTNPCIPEDFRSVDRSFICLEKHALLGTNAIVFPGVTIKEGAMIAAGSIVTKDCEPWGIYMGAPAKRVKERPRDKVLIFENELIQKYGG